MLAQPFPTAPEQTVFPSTPTLAAPSLSPAPLISSARRKNEAGQNQTLINHHFIRQRERLICPGPPSEPPSACSPTLMLMRRPLLMYELTAARRPCSGRRGGSLSQSVQVVTGSGLFSRKSRFDGKTGCNPAVGKNVGMWAASVGSNPWETA